MTKQESWVFSDKKLTYLLILINDLNESERLERRFRQFIVISMSGYSHNAPNYFIVYISSINPCIIQKLLIMNKTFSVY